MLIGFIHLNREEKDKNNEGIDDLL